MVIELSPYIHLPFKIATSRSNGLRMKNVVELHAPDVSWSPGVFAMELHCQFWSGDFGGGVTSLENFLWKCNMGYILYPWISLLESTLETSYKPQT